MRVSVLCLSIMFTVACGDERPSTPTAPGPVATNRSSTFRASGTVVEIGGGTVANATVVAKSCDESPSYNHTFGDTTSDADGAFLLSVDSGSQWPIGCVYLVVSKDSYVSNSIDVNASTANLIIELQRLRRVTGRVVEIDGGPVSGVQVYPGRKTAAVSTDASGFFALGETGQYIVLEKQGYVMRSATVPPGQDADLGTVHFQRNITLSPKADVSTRLSSVDPEYDFYDMFEQGVFCNPCKWIDLETGGKDLDIDLAWSGDTPLSAWIATEDYYAGVIIRVAQPGETSMKIITPAVRRHLLVGVKSPVFGRTPVEIAPIPFTVRATVRE